MTSVTFPVDLGGDGSTVTDDNDPSTGLGQGGHRTRFVPALYNTVAMAQTAVDSATSAASDVALTAADRIAVAADKATVAADKATVAADKATVAADKGIVAADKATVAADKATATAAASTATTQAGIATTQAGIATTQAGNAATSAGNAATSEANASSYTQAVLNAANTIDTSSTSHDFTLGSKIFTVSAGKGFFAGQFLTIARTSDVSKWMHAQVTSYSGTTLTVNVTYINATDTAVTAWNIFGSAPLTQFAPRTSAVSVTLSSSDYVLFDTTAGTITQPLPAPTVSATMIFHRMGANTLIIAPASGVSIRGPLDSIVNPDDLELRDGETIRLAYKTTNVWEII